MDILCNVNENDLIQRIGFDAIKKKLLEIDIDPDMNRGPLKHVDYVRSLRSFCCGHCTRDIDYRMGLKRLEHYLASGLCIDCYPEVT